MRWAKLTLLAGGTILALAALQAPAMAAGRDASPGPGQEHKASLDVSIASLPRGVRARVVVTGPHRFFRYAPRSMTLRELDPGRHVVRARPVRVRSGTLYPVTAVTDVRLGAGESGAVRVSYADDVPDTTKVAAPGSVTGLSGSPAGPATLTLSSLPTGLAAGDIIAIGVTPATPDGFLGKVAAVNATGTGFLVATVPATLMQAMPSGEIGPHWQEPPQDQPVDDSGVSCGAGASLSVTGGLNLTPGGDFSAQWVNGAVTSVGYTDASGLQALVAG